MAVLSRRLGRAPAARRPQLTSLAQLAGWQRQHRRARQRRAEPDGAAARGQPARPSARRRAAAASRRRRPSSACSTAQHRRGRVRLGARIADGADAAADAGHPPVRLRAGRGVCAALSLPQPGRCCRAASSTWRRTCRRRTCTWSRPTATLVARASTPPGADPAVRAGGAARCTAAPAGSSSKGDFPSARNTERPLAKEAQRFYTQRRAAAAALPAVLARQPGRPDVAGAADDRRRC